MRWRAAGSFTAVIAIIAFLVPGAGAQGGETETIGSTLGGPAPNHLGPCHQETDCVQWQSTPAAGATNLSTIDGQVTSMTFRKAAGAGTLQPVIVDPAGAPNVNIVAIGESIALDPAAGTKTYPLASPMNIAAGQTVGVRIAGGPAPDAPLIADNSAPNGGKVSAVTNATGPGSKTVQFTGNYDMKTAFTVTKNFGPPGDPYDLVARPSPDGVFENSVRVLDNGLVEFSSPSRGNIPALLGYVQNDGPATSDEATATITAVGLAPEAGITRYLNNQTCSSSDDLTIQCPVASLQPGAKSSFAALVAVHDDGAFAGRLPFQIAYSVSATCNVARETNCANNSASGAASFAEVGGSTWLRQTQNLLKGDSAPPGKAKRPRADGSGAITRVDVAVLSLDRGLRGFTGSVKPTDPITLAAAKARCQWLKSTKAKFAKSDPDGKICDDPVWLKAKGTSDWSYRLSKPLPDGKYVAYARSTTSDGAVEFYFAKAERNRVEFEIK